MLVIIVLLGIAFVLAYLLNQGVAWAGYLLGAVLGILCCIDDFAW